MDGNALLEAIAGGVLSKPLGTRLLPPMRDEDVTVAIELFSSRVWRDPELERLNISDFDGISRHVTQCSREGSPVNLSTETRLALVVLSCLFSEMHERTRSDLRPHDGGFVLVPLGSDSSSQRSALGEIKASKRWGRMAEDCMLNAAYASSDAVVLVAAGRYYLELMEADVPTAIAYFIAACDRAQASLQACDVMVEDFVRSRSHFYVGMSLYRYLEAWETYKRSHAATGR